jgi:hypothetical protein
MLIQSALNRLGLVPEGCDWLFTNSIESKVTPNNIGLSYLDKNSGEIEEVWYNKFHLANHCKVWLASKGFILLTTITDTLEACAVFSFTAANGEELEIELYGVDESEVVFKATNKAVLLLKGLEKLCEQ